MTYSPYDMPVDEVDDRAMMDGMQGPSSTVNQLAGRLPWSADPARCLVVLWFVVLFAYWAIGMFFRGQRK